MGLATAYYAARDGHGVTIVDRNDGVALETSFANGAQLSYSYVAPLAGPGVLGKIPPWLLRRDSPLRFYPKFHLTQWRWLLQFVLACNRQQSELTTRRLLTLASYSRTLLAQLLAEDPIEFGHASNGKLVVYSDEEGFESARRLVDYQRSLGCIQMALDPSECLALEPALGHPSSALGQRMVGGVHTPSEEVGDCYRFCVGLERRLQAMGVRFVLDTQIRAIDMRGNTVVCAVSGGGEIAGDRLVIAAGAHAAALGRPLGLHLPVYPLKGYSLTLPVQGPSPRVSITDYKRKVVYAPLAASASSGAAQGMAAAMQLRVAGMADIAGYSRRPDPGRVRQLIAEASAAFPAATNYNLPHDQLQPWCGLRPATPKGTPVLGATPHPNVYVNCGQGALGWTLAMASGRVLADALAGRGSEIALDGFEYGS